MARCVRAWIGQAMSDVLAVMPTYIRRKEDLILSEHAARSLRATSDADLLVVDDGSPDLQLAVRMEEICEEIGADFDRHQDNKGFSASVNVGFRRARRMEQNVLLMNADLQFWENDWLDHLRANPADVVGGLLIYPNGLVQHAGIYFSIVTRKFDHIFRMAPGTLAQVKDPRICPVTGALQLIKHETIKKIGIYDENYKLGHEDVDYCHMVFQAGMTCAYEPKAIAVHHESAFRAVNTDKKHVQWMDEGWVYFHEKHKGRDFGEFTPTLIWED